MIYLRNFISKSFDDMKKKIAAVEKTNVKLAKENMFLRQESSHVSNDLNQMKTALDKQEQYIRRDCLEIKGVPTSLVKTQMKLLKMLAQSLTFVEGSQHLSLYSSVWHWEKWTRNCCCSQRLSATMPYKRRQAEAWTKKCAIHGTHSPVMVWRWILRKWKPFNEFQSQLMLNPYSVCMVT